MEISEANQKRLIGIDVILIVSSLVLLLSGAVPMPKIIPILLLLLQTLAGIGMAILALFELRKARQDVKGLEQELETERKGKHKDLLQSLRTFRSSDQFHDIVLAMFGIAVAFLALIVLIKKINN